MNKGVFQKLIAVALLWLAATACATISQPSDGTEPAPQPAETTDDPTLDPWRNPEGEPSTIETAEPVETTQPEMKSEQIASQYGSAIQEGDLLEAEEKLAALSRLGPLDAKKRYDLAVLQSRVGKLAEAIANAKSAFELDPANIEAARLVIKLLQITDRGIEAESFANNAISTDQKNITLRSLLIDAYIAKKEYIRAIREAQTLLKLDEVNIAVMKNMAIAYFYMGKYNTAKYVFKRAEELTKQDYEIAYYTALILDRTEKDRGKAAAAWQLVLKMKPDFPEALNNLGLVFSQTRNYEQAVQYFAMALRYAPTYIEARLNMANALRSLKQYEEAERLYKEITQQNPRYAPAYYNLGLLYLETEFGGLEREVLLLRAADQFRKYKDTMGRNLPSGDQVERYIAEAEDLVQQVRKAREEEVRLKSEQASKLAELGPKGKRVVADLTDLRRRLEQAATAWEKAGDQKNSKLFAVLATEYDDLLSGLVADLDSAINNSAVEDIEYALDELKTATEEFNPKVDDAFSKAPPPPLPDDSPQPEPAPEPEPAPLDTFYSEPAPEDSSAQPVESNDNPQQPEEETPNYDRYDKGWEDTSPVQPEEQPDSSYEPPVETEP